VVVVVVVVGQLEHLILTEEREVRVGQVEVEAGVEERVDTQMELGLVVWEVLAGKVQLKFFSIDEQRRPSLSSLAVPSGRGIHLFGLYRQGTRSFPHYEPKKSTESHPSSYSR
jgi:hypothetical protein